MPVILDACLAHWFGAWFGSIPANSQDNRDALVAISAVAGVVWAGALVAYTIRKKYSAVLSLGVAFLQTGFLQPLICLLAQGGVLRTIASIPFALFVLLGIAIYQRRGNFSSSKVTVTFTSDDAKTRDAARRDKQITQFFRELFDRIANSYVMLIPIGVSAGIVFFDPSITVSAWCSLTLLCLGLICTYGALFYWEIGAPNSGKEKQ